VQTVLATMTEALNESQFFFLRRAAAAGHVSVETNEDRKTLDELIEKKLIIGNQLTDAGWTELRKSRGSLEGLIPFAAPSSRSKANR
jgi:hypothetical protein